MCKFITKGVSVGNALLLYFVFIFSATEIYRVDSALAYHFEKKIPGLGSFALRLYDNNNDAETLHRWVNLEHAKFWMMQGTSVDEVKSAYSEIIASGNTAVFIGCFNGTPAFLLEFYWAKGDQVANVYQAKDGDYGMHILVAPADKPLPKFTWNVFLYVLDFIFSDDKVKRVVVEPDVNNEKIHVLNRKAGFVYQNVVDMPHKRAHLAFCTRDKFLQSLPDGWPSSLNQSGVDR